MCDGLKKKERKVKKQEERPQCHTAHEEKFGV